MSYHIRRIDPYWVASPAVPATAIGGATLALGGILVGQSHPGNALATALLVGGAVVCGIAVLAAIKPAFSAVLGVLGLLGFGFSFFVVPDVQMAGQSIFQRLVSTVIAASVYTVITDALILLIAFSYNFFAALWGGIRLDIEQSGSEGE